MSLPGYTWKCALKYTDNKLETLKDEDLILTLENNNRGGLSSAMGDGYFVSDDSKKILFIDANNMHGLSMSQASPYDGIQMWHGHP